MSNNTYLINFIINNYFSFLENGCLIPLNNNRKFCNIKGWNEKIFTISDFKIKNLSGVAFNMLRLFEKYDICCLDIDLKGEDVSLQQKDFVKSFLFKLHKKYNIYLEETQSGGFHLFFKCKKQHLNTIHKIYTKNDVYVANNVELYPSKSYASRLVVIAPSKTNKGQYRKIYGDLNNLEYLKINDLINIISEFIDIFGVKTENIINTNILNKNLNHSLSDIDNIDLLKKYNNIDKEVKKDLLLLEELLKTDINILYELLDRFNIIYKDIDDRRINIYSIITDDGDNLDAYIFKNTMVYHDFHNNKSYKLIYLLYILNKDIVLEFIEKYIEEYKKMYKKIGKDVINNRNKIKEINMISDIKNELLNGKKLLLAQTGSGKTSIIKELAKTSNKKIIILEPLTTQVLQERKAYPIFCEQIKDDIVNTDSNLIFATYDQLKNIERLINLDDCYIVIDEAHELICSLSYRKRTIEKIWDVLNNRKQYLLMTATNNFVKLEDYVDLVYKLKVKPKKHRYFTIIKTRTPIDDIINNTLSYYKDDVIQFIYIDSKKKLMNIYNTLLENGVKYKDIVMITSDNKTDNAKDIIDNMDVNKKIYLTTRVLSTGFHILSGGCFIYHIIPNDINITIQEINRVREIKDNIIYVNIYNSKKEQNKEIDFNKLYNTIYIQKALLSKEINSIISNDCNIDNLNKTEKIKEYLSGNNYYIFNALKNNFWLKYLVYKDIISIASKNNNFIKQVLINEGFTYNKEKPIIVEINKIEENEIELSSNINGILFDEYMTIAYKNTQFMNEIEKQIYFITRRIIEYYEVFTEDDLNIIKDLVIKNKFSTAKQKISALINKYAVENLFDDKVFIGHNTKAILITKFNKFRKEIENSLRNNKITSKKIKQICKKYNISVIEKKYFLKYCNIYYDKSLKKYIKVIDDGNKK